MSTPAGPMMWVVFGAVVLVMLALDLGVFHRKAHVIGTREAALWSFIWIGVALLFNLGIYFRFGSDKALEFFQAWLIEKALSVDNLFVFLAAFSYFAVPAHLQHRVLFWGIVGALITRGLFIAIGAALLATAHFVLYVFGAFLIFTAVRLMRGGDDEVHPERNPVLAPVQALRPRDARIRRQRLLLPPRRPALRDAAAHGAGGHRSDRRRVRGRLDPRRVRRDHGRRSSSTPRTSSRCSACARSASWSRSIVKRLHYLRPAWRWCSPSSAPRCWRRTSSTFRTASRCWSSAA